ncbi:MAG: nucleotide-binding protein [Fimbriimonadaceae bacterium]|nr:nucleotide-binding protein [Fimbriimonadaceae bacterium]
MKEEKPYLFIGSSQEARERKIVDTFLQALGDTANCVPWFQVPEFSRSGSNPTSRALCSAANNYDFAIFIMTQDDDLTIRKKQQKAPRDNVIFEFGLFLSAIGPERVLAFVEAGADIRLPSDIAGVNAPRFQYDDHDPVKSLSSITTVTRDFCHTIRDEGFRKLDIPLADEWGFDTKSRKFGVELSAAKIVRHRATIGKWSLCVAARIKDRTVNLYDDSAVIYSAARSVPTDISDNIPFEFDESDLTTSTIIAKTTIEARVLMLPNGLTIDPNCTLSHAIKCRCRDIEGFKFIVGD